ncbi:bifunctional folylpolyglutamate synthase/dihydrofolate synthase [Marinilabiliaceae bacterium JC040]|nr:bifunctional folylpolyglutamate synthase/dihydrofolate synthase [Marinilabiliaceae bacterium JC040]
MNYQETLDWMFQQLPMFQRKGKAAYKANLNNTLALDEHFNHPHKNYKTIHIAGTNGKGSVSHFLASCLQEAGYKVGLYTSPHLKDFRERIKINGENIDQDFVVNFINSNKDYFSTLSPSFFEMTVAMAFEYFSKEDVDYAIIETGLGGRLDSTNIISPIASVITNISFDHTALLGNTKELIAIEKAGIIKKDTPVIIGEYDKETIDIFEKRAKEQVANLIVADKKYEIQNSRFNINHRIVDIIKDKDIRFKDLVSGLVGVYQEKNILTCIACIDYIKTLGVDISDENISEGLNKVVENTGIMGRWQILQDKPLVVCDTAHNEAGISYVLEQIKEIPYEKLHIVFGMVNDKSIDKVLSMMPKDAKYYFTKANIPRAQDEQTLKEMASEYGLKGNVYSNVEDAKIAALLQMGNNDLLYIGGSTFIVAEVV